MGASYDLWKVNSDPAYLEEGDALLESLANLERSQPIVPERRGAQYASRAAIQQSNAS